MGIIFILCLSCIISACEGSEFSPHTIPPVTLTQVDHEDDDTILSPYQTNIISLKSYINSNSCTSTDVTNYFDLSNKTGIIQILNQYSEPDASLEECLLGSLVANKISLDKIDNNHIDNFINSVESSTSLSTSEKKTLFRSIGNLINTCGKEFKNEVKLDKMITLESSENIITKTKNRYLVNALLQNKIIDGKTKVPTSGDSFEDLIKAETGQSIKIDSDGSSSILDEENEIESLTNKIREIINNGEGDEVTSTKDSGGYGPLNTKYNELLALYPDEDKIDESEVEKWVLNQLIQAKFNPNKINLSKIYDIGFHPLSAWTLYEYSMKKRPSLFKAIYKAKIKLLMQVMDKNKFESLQSEQFFKHSLGDDEDVYKLANEILVQYGILNPDKKNSQGKSYLELFNLSSHNHKLGKNNKDISQFYRNPSGKLEKIKVETDEFIDLRTKIKSEQPSLAVILPADLSIIIKNLINQADINSKFDLHGGNFTDGQVREYITKLISDSKFKFDNLEASHFVDYINSFNTPGIKGKQHGKRFIETAIRTFVGIWHYSTGINQPSFGGWESFASNDNTKFSKENVGNTPPKKNALAKAFYDLDPNLGNFVSRKLSLNDIYGAYFNLEYEVRKINGQDVIVKK